jgi:hypothetical protein
MDDGWAGANAQSTDQPSLLGQLLKDQRVSAAHGEIT